jgi:hypothetical protein
VTEEEDRSYRSCRSYRIINVIAAEFWHFSTSVRVAWRRKKKTEVTGVAGVTE